MTGQQLLHDLRDRLETNLETLPPESDARAARERDLEDRSLWSGRVRRVA
jgi:hypothetical protein